MTSSIRTAAMAGIVFALAGCATPETRLRTTLVEAGLSQRMAGCMAQRMVQRLSVSQLQRLSALAPLRGRNLGDVTISEYMRRIEAVGDREVIAVATTSAAVCAIP